MSNGTYKINAVAYDLAGNTVNITRTIILENNETSSEGGSGSTGSSSPSPIVHIASLLREKISKTNTGITLGNPQSSNAFSIGTQGVWIIGGAIGVLAIIISTVFVVRDTSARKRRAKTSSSHQMPRQ